MEKKKKDTVPKRFIILEYQKLMRLHAMTLKPVEKIQPFILIKSHKGAKKDYKRNQLLFYSLPQCRRATRQNAHGLTCPQFN